MTSISTPTPSSLERRLTLVVSKAEIDAATIKQLQQMGRKLKIPGFRPGKAPLKIVEQTYGAQARSEAVGDALSKAYGDAVVAQQVRPAGPPQIKPIEPDATAPEALRFEATIEVYPEVPMPQREALSVETVSCEVSEADIDRTLDTLRRQRVTYKPVQRAVQKEDQIKIDFLGKIDGVPFEGGQAEGFEFVAGVGGMLPDFEAAVLGMSAEESKSFAVNFPENYHATNLAGKVAEFSITVHEVREPIFPVLDDAFAGAFGLKEGGLAQLRADVDKNLRREVGARAKNKGKRSVMDALLAQATFEVPQALVDAEAQRMAEEMRDDMGRRGMNVKDAPLPPELFKEPATKRVRLGLLVGEIVKVQKLQPAEEAVKSMLQEMGQSYENPEEFVRWAMSNQQRRAEAEAVVLEDNVVAWVLQAAKVEQKTLDVESLMKEAG
jgi:trigger factor